MRLESTQADRPQHSALSRALCAAATITGHACDRAVRRVIVRLTIAALIGAAASLSLADTVRPGPAIALPFGDIVIPVPMPPSNADPENPASPRDVVTQRYNNLRTGTTLHGGLDQRAVSDGKFGFLKALEVDGVVLAQPLFMANVDFPQKGQRSAVFIATSTNWIYAFDADPPFDKLWETRLGEPFRFPDAFTPENLKSCRGSLMTVAEQDDRGVNTTLVLGIESTPVIDAKRSRIIVSYRSMDGIADGTQRIAALNLRTGEFVKGADGRDLNRRITDNPLWNWVHRNRASLLLDQGRVYVAFSGRCEAPSALFDKKSFQGWIYAFDAESLAFAGRYRSTQDPAGAPPEPTDDPVQGGGIWQASTGVAADGHGNLFFATGNDARCSHAAVPPQRKCGPPDASGKNLSNSIVRLRVDPAPGARPGSIPISMTPADWFTPYRKTWLDEVDLDFAAAGVVLIPNTRYLVAGGKEGMVYVLDRNHLGKFDGSAPFDAAKAMFIDPLNESRGAHTSEDSAALDEPNRDQVVQKFRASENQYCAAGPNPNFCLGRGQSYPRSPPSHGRGVQMNDWLPWPHIHGTPVFSAFPDGRAFLYVWAEKDFLKSFQWWGKRFETTATKIATKLGTGEPGERLLAPPFLGGADANQFLGPVGMPGGMLALSIDPVQPAAGVLFASVQRCAASFKGPDAQDKQDAELRELHECSVQRCQLGSNCDQQHFGILRAFDPITLREIWNNQIDPFASDPKNKRYWFAKFVPPTIANGRIFLPTGSQRVLVYGRH